MKTIPVTVNVDGTPQVLYIRKLKYREASRIGGLVRGDRSGSVKAPDREEGESDDDYNARVISFFNSSIRPEDFANYQVNLIASAVVNADGKPFFTADEIDDWEDTAQISTLVAAIQEFNKKGNTAVEDASGNSAATASGASSSV